MKKEKSNLRQVIRGIFILILVLLIAIVVQIIIAANSHEIIQRIQLDKVATYTIYNEGLESYDYDEVTINSLKWKDMELLYYNGLRYVTYPDLAKIEITSKFGSTIKYDGKSLKYYNDNILLGFKPIKYIKILVDKEHIEDITYYQYKEVIDFNAIIINALKAILYIAIFIILVLVSHIIVCIIIIFFLDGIKFTKTDCEDEDFEEKDTQENVDDEHEEDENVVEENKEE